MRRVNVIARQTRGWSACTAGWTAALAAWGSGIQVYSRSSPAYVVVAARNPGHTRPSFPPAGTRVLVEVTINTPTPDTTLIAINTAGQTGTLSASLRAAGVTFDSMHGTPSPAPVQPPTDGSPDTSGGGSGGSNTGAIVGGVVGGVVGLALAAVVAFLVSSHRAMVPLHQGRCKQAGMLAHA